MRCRERPRRCRRGLRDAVDKRRWDSWEEHGDWPAVKFQNIADDAESHADSAADEDHRRPPPVGDCSPALGCEPTQFVLHVLHWRGQALVPRQSPRPDLLRPAPHPRGRRPILEQPRGGANEAATMRSWFIAAHSPGLSAQTGFSAGLWITSARNAPRISRRARSRMTIRSLSCAFSPKRLKFVIRFALDASAAPVARGAHRGLARVEDDSHHRAAGVERDRLQLRGKQTDCAWWRRRRIVKRAGYQDVQPRRPGPWRRRPSPVRPSPLEA